MSLDVVLAAAVCLGESHNPGPYLVEGVFVEPPTQTRSSQVTGTGTTTLRAAYTGGRLKLLDKVIDVAGAEATIVAQSSYMTSGQARWFALCAVQHRPNAAINLIWVPGTIAAVADAVVPTDAQIQAFLDLDEEGVYVICGDLRFHRSADTTIVHAAKDLRRPAYVQTADKTGILFDETDQSTMGKVYGDHIDFQMGLVQMSGVSAGSMYIDGASFPRWPFGGEIAGLEYVAAVNATGSGATQDLIVNIDGTPTTGGTLTLTLANAVVPVPVTSTITGANKFKCGDGLDIEVDNAGTDFTAGSGTLRVKLNKYVRR